LTSQFVMVKHLGLFSATLVSLTREVSITYTPDCSRCLSICHRTNDRFALHNRRTRRGDPVHHLSSAYINYCSRAICDNSATSPRYARDNPPLHW
jgi:hypothetical protein